jgi:hypothetical protein
MRFLLAILALLALMSCATQQVEDTALQFGSKHHAQQKDR